MDWTWLPPVTLIGAVLLFVTTAWKLLQEHSAIRRLERLADVRNKVEANDKILGPLDRALVSLSERVARREAPKNWSGRAAVVASTLAALAGVGSVIVIWFQPTGNVSATDFAVVAGASIAALLSGGLTVAIAAIARRRRLEEEEKKIQEMLLKMMIHERKSGKLDQAASA